MSIFIQSNTVTVSKGTTINYSVSKTGYTTQTGTETSLQEDKTISVILSGIYVTYTIVPTPADATVTLTATGYTQSGNSITVLTGTTVRWEVKKTNYYTQSGTTVVIGTSGSTITKSIVLISTPTTLTIVPTPSDSVVTLIASGFSQVSNTITVEKGTTISWSVSKTNYNTESGIESNLQEDKTLTVNLQLKTFTFTINPTPADATVTLTASGYTQVGNSITVPYGTIVNYSVSKTGYVTQSNSLMVTSTTSRNVILEENPPVNFIFRDIDASGNVTKPTGTLDSGALITHVGFYGLAYAFNDCTSITGSIDLSGNTTLSSMSAMQNAFSGCTGITGSVDLSGLTTISGSYAMQNAFSGCTGITSVDLSSLTTIAIHAMNSCFKNCTSLTSVTIGGTTAIDFGSYTNQFENMFQNCTQNITVTAPAASQSTIEAMTGYPNFGGTGTVTWNWR